MASLTAFFKPVESPNKKAPAAAAANSPASKPTAASRKRKSATKETEEDGADEEGAEEGAEADGAEEEAEVPAAKKLKLEGLAGLVPSSWSSSLAPEFSKPYWPSIDKFLRAQETAGKKVFPPRAQFFRALDLCPLDQVSVVILGQDPYHDDGQAEGLCFSVPPGQKTPSSLNNMYKELKDDLGEKSFKKPNHGNLVKWAQQGILLLNTGLTVEAHKANSHKSIGWFNFTDAIIRTINKERKGVVFLLWGKHAQDKGKLIDKAKHHVLNAAHPSGLSASKGFYGCKHFSKTNALLTKEGKKPIVWQV